MESQSFREVVRMGTMKIWPRLYSWLFLLFTAWILSCSDTSGGSGADKDEYEDCGESDIWEEEWFEEEEECGENDFWEDDEEQGSENGDFDTDVSSGPVLTEPPSGFALSFDDDFIDQWWDVRDLFTQYDVKVTFFITRFDKLTEERIEKLRDLRDLGHEIGCHSLTHADPEAFMETHTVQEYVDQEIVPALELMRAAGFEVTSFSYPWGWHTPELDEALFEYFTVLRMSGNLGNPTGVYYDWSGARLVKGASIDTKWAELDEITDALETAAIDGTCLMLYSHRILDESEKSHTTRDRLEAVFQKARKLGLKSYVYGDLRLAVGSEMVYGFLDDGEVEKADLVLEDIWDVANRFEPVKLDWPLTWTEDPYNENYWRFIFYSLRPTRHLLAAYRRTGDERYLDKLVAILKSFSKKGLNSPHVDDKHTSAFLGMVAVNCYCKLKRWRKLDNELKEGLLRVIESRGEFLEKEENFEDHDNHGVTEAAALAVIGHNLRSLPKSAYWRQLAAERMEIMVENNVDEDGVQIEQSPFYHFYVFNFFWQIYHWGKLFQTETPPALKEATEGMIRFATYLTHPDGSIPLIGSSTKYDVRKQYQYIYAQAAESDPAFAWVWSAGKQGTPPEPLNKLFPTAGWAILRSSFGTADNFNDPTHIVFDVGPYRTGHSHRDALNLTLYAHDRTLLTDSGLFTYEDGTEFDYYFGTAAHNTVVVDGKSQEKGSAEEGAIHSGDGYACASGRHGLYDGVTHRRALALIGGDLVVVWDHLTSGGSHEYAQRWHLFPEAQITQDNLTLRAAPEGAAPELAIYQALGTDLTLHTVKGQTDPYDGWLSITYEAAVENWAVEYVQNGKTADFVTVFALGELAAEELAHQAAIDGDALSLDISWGQNHVKLHLDNDTGVCQVE